MRPGGPFWDLQEPASLAGFHIILPTDSTLERRLHGHTKVFILQTRYREGFKCGSGDYPASKHITNWGSDPSHGSGLLPCDCYMPFPHFGPYYPLCEWRRR